MRLQYSGTKTGTTLIWITLLAILSGCAAFEAGNILGAVAGISIVTNQLPVPLIVGTIGLISGILLWKGNIRQIATLLGLIVAVMGICFVITAFLIPHDLPSLFSEGFVPIIPVGAELLVLGLIGTTVVPYNIFLGSGLKHTQTPSEMKLSLLIAIGLGGFISICILLTGTAIAGEFTFEALATALTEQLGGWGNWLLGIGLFGAGLSSTLTAALAAAITAKSLLATSSNNNKWSTDGFYFRSVWMGVLSIGLLFGLLELQPVPVIILAQALNGIILPVIAVILFLMMNQTAILPKQHQNSTFYNILSGFVVYLTVLIGLTNLLRALAGGLGFSLPDQNFIFLTSVLIFAVLMIPVIKKMYSRT